MRIIYKNALLVSAILLALFGGNVAEAQTNIKYAGALTFSPEGTMFVGDNVTGNIFAFETGAGQMPAAIAKPLGVNNIDARVADVLGVEKKKYYDQRNGCASGYARSLFVRFAQL